MPDTNKIFQNDALRCSVFVSLFSLDTEASELEKYLQTTSDLKGITCEKLNKNLQTETHKSFEISRKTIKIQERMKEDV